MANVHTLSDLNNNNNNGGGGGYNAMAGQQAAGGPMAQMQPTDEESKQAMGLFAGLSGGGQGQEKPPREENYWDMWKYTFCPKFSPYSFTFLIWCINTVVYVFTLLMQIGGKSLNDMVFLGPDLRTLHTWGALDAWKIQQNFQVWRLGTSLILSTGFTTYCISSGALLVIGFLVENPKMTVTKMAIFYLCSGILGNIFSVSVQHDCSVGCMPSVMGLVGGLISLVIVNWNALKGAGCMRICLIFMIVILFVIVLLLSSQNDAGIQWEGISMAGEGGGFMAGICLGMMLMPHALQRPSPYVKMVRKIGFALTFIFCAVMFPVFFFAVDTTPTIWAL